MIKSMLKGDRYSEDQVIATPLKLRVFNLFEFDNQITCLLIIFSVSFPFENKLSIFGEAWLYVDLFVFVAHLWHLRGVSNLHALVANGLV